MTAPARFNIESTYYREVTGDWEKSCEVLSQWVAVFPHDVIARDNFSSCLSILGQPDRALGEAREAARLLPAAHTYGTWIHRSLMADRVDEAQTSVDDALRRGFDSIYLFDLRVRLAFLRRDDEAAGFVRLGARRTRPLPLRFRPALRPTTTQQPSR